MGLSEGGEDGRVLLGLQDPRDVISVLIKVKTKFPDSIAPCGKMEIRKRGGCKIEPTSCNL